MNQTVKNGPTDEQKAEILADVIATGLLTARDVGLLPLNYLPRHDFESVKLGLKIVIGAMVKRAREVDLDI